ncbi:DUF1707 SHOCT-like domain-containing protein [Salininema proteolyticum]|uniref:DUF1707 domain-containing protein n=1 Tax=Salininema proteolyticum TaxID=1607685 RepID=A0ABV8TWK0_9ACTN
MDRDRMRASESDRQGVLEQLRTAAQDGRLDLTEYQERMEAAMQARTYSELDLLVVDLQRLAPPGQPQVQAQRYFPDQRDSDGSAARSSRWRTVGVSTLIAVGVALGLILIFPDILVYIVVGALVILVLFIIAAVLGLF